MYETGADTHWRKTLDAAGNYTAYTYGGVDSLVRGVAATLDLPPQGKLAVIGGPTIETAVLVLASAFLGCHHTVVIPALPQDSVVARLDLFDPDTVVVPTSSTFTQDKTSRHVREATLKITRTDDWV